MITHFFSRYPFCEAFDMFHEKHIEPLAFRASDRLNFFRFSHNGFSIIFPQAVQVMVFGGIDFKPLLLPAVI